MVLVKIRQYLSVTRVGLICWQRPTLPAAGGRFYSAGLWVFHLSEAAAACTDTHMSQLLYKTWQKNKNRGLPSKARPTQLWACIRVTTWKDVRGSSVGHYFGKDPHTDLVMHITLRHPSPPTRKHILDIVVTGLGRALVHTQMFVAITGISDRSLQKCQGQRQGVWFFRIY